MTITLRPAGEKDMEWLMIQLRDFDKFAAFKRSLVEDDAYARLALKALVDDHVCYIAVGDAPRQGGVRMGFIAGFVTPHAFNPRIRVLTEAFWWVPSEFRHSRAGLTLLNEFVKQGRERGCDWITFSLEHKSPVRPETLTRRGFAVKEQSFLLEV